MSASYFMFQSCFHSARDYFSFDSLDYRAIISLHCGSSYSDKPTHIAFDFNLVSKLFYA
jgi:hypothetical protein